MDEQTLEDRLRSVERAVSDDTTAPIHQHQYEDRLEDIETRLRELEAATQALRGYVGDVRTNETHQQRHTDSSLGTIKQMDATDPTHPHEKTQPPDVPGTDEDDDTLLNRIDEWL